MQSQGGRSGLGGPRARGEDGTMRPINLRVGTASAIGSLPHRQVDAAVAVAMAACPDLPAAPSLPRLDPREGMISQGLWGLRGVAIGDGRVGHADRPDRPR